VNWYDYSYVRYRNYNYKVEVQPTASIGGGQYSLYILYFDSSKTFLGEVQWADARNSTDLQVLPSVAVLAAQNGVTNIEYYYLRFRLHGNVGDGFIFDEIRVSEGLEPWPQTALTTAAPKAVFAHEMIGFRTPEYSGYWKGWNQYSHNPAVLDGNGRPDIASVCYPSVGYYDMADPDLVEYHCQSMKMAGIDGVIFDLSFYSTDMATVNMISDYLDIMADYGLQGVICYEDKTHWLWDSSATTRAIALQRSYEDMDNWLALFINSGTQYNVTGTRPLFLLFSYETDMGSTGISCLSPSEITDWLNTFSTENKPVIMRQWFKNPDHVGVLNGQFSWPVLYPAPPEMAPYVGYCDMDDNNNTLYNQRDFGQYLFENSLADFHMPGVWPGFDDYAVWGWGNGPRLMPRYDGQLYQNTWNWAIEDDLPVVQIATWNDWFEATIIEPAVEFGNLYLELTFENTSEFKNLPASQDPNFNVPIWIYKIRDITNDPLVLADMTTAGSHIIAGQFDLAEQIVRPWADYFAIDSVTYWTGSGSITTEPDIQVAPSLSFSTIPVGTSEIKSVTVINAGTAPLIFTSVSIISGQADFTITETFDTSDLSVTQSRQAVIKFEPQSQGAKAGVLRIITNDPDSTTVDVDLTGDASMAGDYYPDDKIDLKDLAEIGPEWQGKYSFDDLVLIAVNWLNQ
ncbi:MAG: choice-of-anchor D domain-containing protein, partial [Sedimentisphaerales bacterium]|nr:choice-of-anchor D domain-containing protein [Sedimentisphaerales bacterium]